MGAMAQRHTHINSLCDLPNEPDAVLIGFAQAKDAARADTDPRLAHGRDGAQSLVVRPRGDHLAKKKPKTKNQKPRAVVCAVSGYGAPEGKRTTRRTSG